MKRPYLKPLYILILLPLLGYGCKTAKKEYQPAYALNIVYFLPKDKLPIENYRQRLSDILLYTQDFYRQGMKNNGFGDKTFGLRKDSDGKVKISVIPAQQNADYYPYEGGGWKAVREIDAWFAEHPEEKSSEHTLVFMPTITEDTNPGGVPFYGLGKICFALDYKYFDLKHLGDPLLAKWLGGMAHELGHGLNLPHNSETVSTRQSHGTALMGNGNYTLSIKPTFLTKASCGILNNCQVFSSVKQDFYSQPDTAGPVIRNLHIEFKEHTIDIRSGFNIPLPFNGINIYFDNAPYGEVNTDYDAESFFVKPQQQDSLAFRIPKNELFNFAGADFQIRIIFLCTNGSTYYITVPFNKNSPADFHFIKKTELNKSKWSVTASDMQPDSPVSNILDGNIQTFWHSSWFPYKKDFPHNLTITLDKTQKIRGLTFTQRNNLHGAIKEILIRIRTKGKWKKIGLYTLKAEHFQEIDFPQPENVEAFSIDILSNHTENDPKIATLAEIGAY